MHQFFIQIFSYSWLSHCNGNGPLIAQMLYSLDLGRRCLLALVIRHITRRYLAESIVCYILSCCKKFPASQFDLTNAIDRGLAYCRSIVCTPTINGALLGVFE